MLNINVKAGKQGDICVFRAEIKAGPTSTSSKYFHCLESVKCSA